MPAGDPTNPWALAHGLLALGPEFKAADGRSAIQVIASFAEHSTSADGRSDRYAFPAQRSGKPVEPHSYLLVKTFLEIELSPSASLRTADGTTIDVRRLLTDMRASIGVPQDEHQWHDAAWWLSALALDPATDAAMLTTLTQVALAKLEADDAVLASATDTPQPFSPNAPMGQAKRNKSHIYGHPCGGLHFFQAVLRCADRVVELHASHGADVLARVQRQVQLLVARYQAERALYAEMLRARPEATLLVSGQQLKFFGHLLETLALADRVLPSQDNALKQTVTLTRQQAASDVLTVIAQLQAVSAYARLNELSVQQPQLYLDLIGDGCHAIHGLRETLPVLSSASPSSASPTPAVP